MDEAIRRKAMARELREFADGLMHVQGQGPDSAEWIACFDYVADSLKKYADFVESPWALDNR